MQIKNHVVPHGILWRQRTRWILMENQRALLAKDFDEKEAGLVLPAGFIGQPQDIGRLAIFLASDDARYIISQTVICDGGQT